MPIPQEAWGWMLGGIPPALLVSSSPSSFPAGRGQLCSRDGDLEDFGHGRRVGRGVRSSRASPAPWGAAVGVTRYEVMGTHRDRPALWVARLSQASSGNPRAQPCGESRAEKTLSKKKKSQNPPEEASQPVGQQCPPGMAALAPSPSVPPGEPGLAAHGPQ